MRKNDRFTVRLGYALSGIAHAFRHERSIRTQCAPLRHWSLVLLFSAPNPCGGRSSGFPPSALSLPN